MKTIRKSLIIGMTILGLAGSTFAVQAQDAAASAQAATAGHGAAHGHAHKHGGKHGDLHGKRAERQAQRLQQLHGALKLAPAQEAAWASYTSALKPAARAERGERKSWKDMTAPERMEQRLAMARKRVEMMEARTAATTTFYGSLTAEQKKLFDENSARRGAHRHHMKRGLAS